MTSSLPSTDQTALCHSPAAGDRVRDVIGAVRRVQTASPPARGSPRTPEVEVGGRRQAAAAQDARFQQPVRPVDVEVEDTEGARGQGGGDTTLHAPHRHTPPRTHTGSTLTTATNQRDGLRGTGSEQGQTQARDA